MNSESLRAAMGKCEDRVFSLPFKKKLGSLRLHLLVVNWVERRRLERLQSQSGPESSSEFVALAERIESTHWS